MTSLISNLTIVALFMFIDHSYLLGQSNKKVSNKNYYEFINEIVVSDSVMQFNLASEPDFKHILDDTSFIFRDTTFFSSGDAQFMRQQLTQGKHFKWKSNRITGAHVISSKKIRKYFKNDIWDGWKIFNKKHRRGFTKFSIPLFTLDRETCIIYKGRHCGSLCGGGGIYLYKKVEGKWEYVTTIGTIWMS
ncbi:MAG: hypothetical protein WDN26_04610 [Chitinophagaceae bacterium]